MKQDELTSLVKKQATQQIGFDLIGIADASDSQFDHAPPGHKPTEYLVGAKSVIVGGREVIDEMAFDQVSASSTASSVPPMLTICP